MKKIEIKRILVPVDFTETSDEVTIEAIKLAKLLKADVFLLHIIGRNWAHLFKINEIQTILPSAQEVEKVLEKRLIKMQEEIKQKFGIKPEVNIKTGHIHSETIDFSKEQKIDLIVMGAHGASGLKDFFIGTNTQRVVTLSEIPVLTMQKNSNKAGFKNILLPIDNSLHSREKINLAMIIANLFGAKIHIIGLPESDKEDELNKFHVKVESVEKIVKADNMQYKTTIVHGDNLATSAINYATKNKCDLIVINTGHESKITGILLGAFAQQIVNHSKIPVLSLRHAHGNFSIDTPGYGIS